jgi:hypothetical protein
LLRRHDNCGFMAGMSPRLHVLSQPHSHGEVTAVAEQLSVPVSDAGEARARSSRAFYQDAVASYLGARTAEERSVLGDAMYLAQLATMEARFNPEGCARFRALAELKMTACTATLDGAAEIRPWPARSGSMTNLDVVGRPSRPVVGGGLDLPRAA